MRAAGGRVLLRQFFEVAKTSSRKNDLHVRDGLRCSGGVRREIGFRGPRSAHWCAGLLGSSLQLQLVLGTFFFVARAARHPVHASQPVEDGAPDAVLGVGLQENAARGIVAAHGAKQPDDPEAD